jgi:photosystem II stability/assembly factor-like uncharacterized protein
MRKLALATLLLTATSQAQFQLQDSHSTASLRGIHSLGNGVAWASGTEGTILRTTDDGQTWQRCATPPEADKLDFRGIQAFDQNTAIVMSSGKGDLSRLYKTTDGCKSWTLVFANPDKDGFWDNLFYDTDDDRTFILGDPVDGQFQLIWAGEDNQFHATWNGHPIRASKGEAAFAASNSLFAMVVGDGAFSFITGGSVSEIIHEEHGLSGDPKIGIFSGWWRSPLPFNRCNSCGAFSMFAAPYNKITKEKIVVIVGGDYLKPNSADRTAAYSRDWGGTFRLSKTFPHGYRSSVVYDATTKAWITVGLNGTDISRDDGKNWTALKPTPQDTPDADKNWNALSLPFVVGPKGRIGKLRPEALKP